MSVVVAIAVVATGFGLTALMSPRLRFEERLAAGPVVGTLAVSAVALVAFLAFGMGWPALVLGLVVPGLGASWGVVRSRHALSAEARWAWRRLRLPAADPRSLRPFTLLAVAATVVATRVLSLSYQAAPEGLRAGSLAVWGDWSAHLAYAASFAEGDNRALELPIAAGAPFRYHLLSDFAASLFTVTGASLPQALTIGTWLLAVALPLVLWCVVEHLTRSRATAALTVVLFTLSGGLGAWYFLTDVRAQGWSIVTSLPRTYARVPEQHLWVDNTISAALYAQRSTLLGLSAGLAALLLVLVSRPSGRRAGLVGAGLVVGALGIGHGHTFLTALALGVMALLAERRRTLLWFLVPAAAVGLPLAVAILPETNSVRVMIGWMAPGADQSWPWFWLRNVGLLLPIFAALSLFGGAPQRLRRLTAPLWLWFVVPNIVAFHPAEWNNTKYFLYWQLAGSLLVASWLARLLQHRAARSPAPRLALRVGAAALVVVMVSAGALDTLRSMQRSTAIPWADADDLAAAAWLRDHTDADAVVVHGMVNDSAISSIGGRRAVSGYVGWTHDLGLADWDDRWYDTRAILAGGEDALALVERYGVDVVVIGPVEREQHDASDTFWSEQASLAFRAGEYRLYRVPSPGAEIAGVTRRELGGG